MLTIRKPRRGDVQTNLPETPPVPEGGLRPERDEAHVALLQEAVQVLGYRPSTAADSQESDRTVAIRERADKEDKRIRSIAQLEALQRVGIRPFNDRDVARYKKRKLWQERDRALSQNGVYWALICTASVLTISIFALLSSSTVGIAIGSSLAVFAVVLAMVTLGGFVSVGGEWSWVRTYIASYSQAIPTYALETAIEVKKAIPKCHIVIEHLRQDTRPKGDPFLCIELPNDQIVYLEVWDEPNFGSQRTV